MQNHMESLITRIVHDKYQCSATNISEDFCYRLMKDWHTDKNSCPQSHPYYGREADRQALTWLNNYANRKHDLKKYPPWWFQIDRLVSDKIVFFLVSLPCIVQHDLFSLLQWEHSAVWRAGETIRTVSLMAGLQIDGNILSLLRYSLYNKFYA